MSNAISDLKPGMIAHLKTTDEPVFVLDIKPLSGPHVLSGMLSGVQAYVRRPTLDEHGKVEHKLEYFLIDELESKEEASARKVRDMETLKAQFAAERNSHSPSNVGQSN